MKRAGAYIVSAALIAAVWLPVIQNTDSFPLSNYPMFSKARPSIAHIDHAVGVLPNGDTEVIPPNIVGSGEVLQAKTIVSHTIRRGRRAAGKLCRAIAGRAPNYERIEIRSDSYDVLGYLDGNTKPVKSRVHARCTARATR